MIAANTSTNDKIGTKSLFMVFAPNLLLFSCASPAFLGSIYSFRGGEIAVPCAERAKLRGCADNMCEMLITLTCGNPALADSGFPRLPVYKYHSKCNLSLL